jgi:Protein of unknown function (DUF3000)
VPHPQPLRAAGQPESSHPGEAEFRQAVAQVQAGLAVQRELRTELAFEDEPPPRRLAPFAYAIAVAVSADSLSAGAQPAGALSAGALSGAPSGGGRPGGGGQGDALDGEAEIGWGKFVLLFDAAGQRGWDGKHRIIGYVRAELEPEMAADPLINAVGWSWLTEALDVRSSGYRKISGTVTTVVTQGFGGKQDEPTSTGFELRASWSPVIADGISAELDGHVAAWCDVICMAAGLPPLPPGVAALRPQRRRPRQ